MCGEPDFSGRLCKFWMFPLRSELPFFRALILAVKILPEGFVEASLRLMRPTSPMGALGLCSHTQVTALYEAAAVAEETVFLRQLCAGYEARVVFQRFYLAV